MNIAVQFELQDDQERQAFLRFADMIEKYRLAKWQSTQKPEPVAETPPPAEEPPAPQAVEPAQTAAGPACSICGRGVGVCLAPDESPCPGHAPTLAELQKRFTDYALTHELKQARALLTEFGINRVPELPKERYAEFMGRMNQIVVSA